MQRFYKRRAQQATAHTHANVSRYIAVVAKSYTASVYTVLRIHVSVEYDCILLLFNDIAMDSNKKTAHNNKNQNAWDGSLSQFYIL